MQICVLTARRMLTGKSANQQRRVPISYWRAGLEVLCERGVSWIESRHDSEACQEVTTVGDRGPARLSFFYQRWASVSERKLWANPLVLPARLSGAAAGNCAQRNIGKACCLLLVQADYIGPLPRARPRGHGDLLKLLWYMTIYAVSIPSIFRLLYTHFEISQKFLDMSCY